jgi:hypothetical protein
VALSQPETAKASSKVVLVAIMRKLIVLANALLRDGRTWSEFRA